MYEINRLPETCPDHPENGTYWTRSRTSNKLPPYEYRVRQHLCAEGSCPNGLGWIYENPEDKLSGTGLCPQQFLDTVKAERLKVEIKELWIGFAGISAMSLIITYFLTLTVTEQTWTPIHSLGISVNIAMVVIFGKIIHQITKNKSSGRPANLHEEAPG